MILKHLPHFREFNFIPKNHLVELGGIFLPFFLFLIYNLVLTATEWFEFDDINTARVANSFVHTCLWALLAHFMNDILYLLWTNLLWRNLDVKDNEKERGLYQKGCSGETLSWLTSRPLSGILNVVKLRSGYHMALMIFGFLYLQRAAQSLFTNVNPISTVMRDGTPNTTIDAGWFHKTMWYSDLLGSYTANLQVTRNEVEVKLNGTLTKIWLPPNLNLSHWTSVQTTAVLPSVKCKVEELSGEWDDGTFYPFGLQSSAKCFANIRAFNESYPSGVHELKSVGTPGVHIPKIPLGEYNSIGCYDGNSAKGLFVFLYVKFAEDVASEDNPKDFGVLE
jgi:hypothetical protein